MFKMRHITSLLRLQCQSKSHYFLSSSAASVQATLLPSVCSVSPSHITSLLRLQCQSKPHYFLCSSGVSVQTSLLPFFVCSVSPSQSNHITSFLRLQRQSKPHYFLSTSAVSVLDKFLPFSLFFLNIYKYCSQHLRLQLLKYCNVICLRYYIYRHNIFWLAMYRWLSVCVTPLVFTKEYQQWAQVYNVIFACPWRLFFRNITTPRHPPSPTENCCMNVINLSRGDVQIM